MEDSKYDLDAPAFGEGAKPAEEEATPADADETELTNETEETEPEESDEDTGKVKYSRFKKFHDRALEYQTRYEEAQKELERLRSGPEKRETQDLPQEWIDLYGDSDQSKRAYKLQQDMYEKQFQEFENNIRQSLQAEREQETVRVSENLETLDSGFEELAEDLGRDLTDKEQSELLDIIDDYTPKDQNGNYLGQILSFEKAWEIYELKQSAAQGPKRKSRDKVAGLTGVSSEGAVQPAERDKNFVPGAWSNWQERIPE